MIIKTKKIAREWVNKKATCRCCGYLPHSYKRDIQPKVERARIKNYIKKEIEQ